MDLSPIVRLVEETISSAKPHSDRQRARIWPAQSGSELTRVVPDKLLEQGEFTAQVAATVTVVHAVASSGKQADIGCTVGHCYCEVGIVPSNDDSVYERQSIDVAPGDRLMLTANRRDAGFRATNGELVTVRGIDGGRLQLEDGRTLPANYHQFDHGYAISAHHSQGKTVDKVILSADAMKQRLFYVRASRGLSNIATVTSDREQLRESLGISSARPSATELAREQAHLPQPEHKIQQAPAQRIQPPVPRHEISIRHDIGLGL